MAYLVSVIIGIVCVSLTHSAGLRGKSFKGKMIAGRQMHDPYAGDIIKVAIVETPESWESAEEFCELQGGMLLKITDSDVEGELEEYLDDDEELVDRQFWMGANDLDEYGKYTFPDGSDVNYWHGADVPTKESEGNCVALSPHGGGSFTWEIRPCADEKSYLCELPMDPEDEIESSSDYVPDDFSPQACNEFGDYPFDCDTNLCDVETCPANPESLCVVDNCGGCFAHFYDYAGDSIDCKDASSESNSGSNSNSDEICNEYGEITQDCEGIDMCDREACIAYPDAICMSNDCGECCANWYNNGQLIDCDDACCMAPEKGGCEDEIPLWFYNCETKKCDIFIWSGCDGNDNRFKSEDECRLECVIWETSDPKPCNRR